MLNYIKFFVYTSTLFFCSFSFGQTFTVDFDDDTKWFISAAGYQTNNEYNDQNWLFTGGPALRQGTAAQDGFPGALGTYSWRLRDAAGVSWTATFNGTADISAFGFDVRRWDNSPDPDYTVEYSVNAGGVWNAVATINNAFLGGSSDWFTFSQPIASASVTPGDFIVRVSRNNGERIMIDNFSWTESVSSNTISTDAISSLTFNVDCDTDDTGTVTFTSVGTFNVGNVFTVQLSDEFGSFASPVTIGTLSGAGAEGIDLSGTISITIPAGTNQGNGYRIRVISSNPGVAGTDNGTNITINLTGGPCVLEPPHMTSLIINSCNSSCGEGNNEVVFANTGDYSVLMNSANFELTYGNSPSPTTVYTNPLVTNSGTTDDLNSEAGCPGLFIDATNTTIPPNSIIMLAHDEICPGDVLDFGNLCGSGPIYVVYTQDPSWSLTGNFVNSSSCSGGMRYLTTTITSTDGTTHVIDYSFDCTLNSGTDGDYAKWNYLGGASIDQGNNGCTLEPVVLPITLSEFSGHYNGHSTDLDWTTLSEQNNDYFALYHSTNGKSFELIGTVAGSGNTTTLLNYSYEHRTPHPGINYYKLKSVDYDGTMHDKGIIAVLVEMNHIFYDQITQSIQMNYESDYAVYGSDGRLVKRVLNQNSIPFSGNGVFHVIDERSGKAFKLGVW